MKEEDVRIGMKVVPHNKTAMSANKGLKSSAEWKKAKAKEQFFLYVVRKEGVFSVLNTNKNDISGDYFNACDFEPYIDIELMEEQLDKAIEHIKETVAEYFKPLFEGLIAFVEKNKDTIEKLVEESKEEKLEKEIMEAFDEYTNKECSYSLQTCFRAGFLAGRESK